MTGKIIHSILGIFFGLAAVYAQTGVVRVVAVSQKFQMLPSPLPEAEVVDTARLTAYYLHTYPVDNFSEGFDAAEDTVAVQIGARVCKTYSQNLHLWDRNLTYQEENIVRFRSDYVGYEVFCNYPQGKITTQHRIPFSRLLTASTQVAEFSEKLPKIDWQISDRRDSVGGYSCIFAEGRFGGRTWKVWFSPEIPLPCGPWKLGGLPGLILKAEDGTGAYKFDLQRLSTAPSPVELYDWHPVRMSKSQWLKKERHMHEHPNDYFSHNGEIEVMDHKTRRPLTEKWTVRYDPIELE